MRALKISLLFFILSSTVSAQNFWQQTNGPYGIPTVYDFLKYNDSTIFLGTDEGILRSKDNGETWSRINGQYLNAQIRGITKDHFGTLYAGRNDTEYGLKMLFKSSDQGDTWQSINYNFDAEIRYIFIPYKDTIMLGSWDMGVIRSFDGGVTWSRVNNGNIYNGIYEIIQLDDGSVLAGSAGGGVFKTTNWGDSWVPSNTGLPTNSQGYRFAKSFYKTAPNCILVGTQVAIYYSTNNGESWSFKSTGLTNKEINRIVKDESGIFYAGTDMSNGVYYSTNGGDYWYHLGLNLTTYTIGWDSESRLYAGGSSQGLYRFVIEDSTWIQVYNQGYNPVEVDDLCLTRSGYLFTITHWDGLQWSSNNGESWTRINFPGVNPYAIETIDDSIFIAGKGNIYVSNNYGNAWFIPADFGILGKNSLQYDSTTQILYAGSESFANGICGIYTSTDSGQNWELLSTLPMTATRKWVTALWVTRTNKIILANVIYAWPQSQYSRFFKSSDNGQSWEIISEGNVVHQIVEDGSSVLYATSSNGLMVSEDEGKTWTTKSISGSWCLATDYSGRIYHDLTCSTDKGNTWFDLPISGFNAWFNEDLAISHSNRIYAASTEGIFYGEADSIVVSVEKNEPIKTFNLCQNYPNPFNPTTSLQYAIGSRQFVTLKVYDIIGSEIATLVNEEKSAGEYEVEFDGSLLTSGIYFYQLKAGQYSETKKMVLMK